MPQSDVRPPGVATLRRYTDIPALIYMLRRRRLTLLNPGNWDDKNDSHFIELYREKKQLGAVLALCFTEVGETYHHWRVFAPGTSGVCVRFKKDALLGHLLKKTTIRAGAAQYKMLNHVRTAALSAEDLPFLKRYAFRDEQEFRLVYNTRHALQSKDFSLPLECIDRITINPWLNERLADGLWDTIRELKGCEHLIVGQSSLVNNREWKKLGASAA
jgi:hypothetical protein